MGFFKYIISVFLIIAILFSSVLAIDSSNNLPAVVSQSSRSNFYGWISTLLNGGSLAEQASLLWHDLIDDHLGCPNNNGGRHFFNFDTTVSLITGTVNDGAICSLCGMTYGDYCTGIHAAYDSYVDAIEADLGSTSISESGSIRYYLPAVSYSKRGFPDDGCIVTLGNISNFTGLVAYTSTSNSYNWSIGFNFYYDNNISDIKAPCFGTYSLKFDSYHEYSAVSSTEGNMNMNKDVGSDWDSNLPNDVYIYGGSRFRLNTYNNFRAENDYKIQWHIYRGGIGKFNYLYTISGNACCYIVFTPQNNLESLTQVDISPSTRIGSIPGNIGYLDTSTNTYIVTGGRLINEDNRTIYNPITDTTTTYEDYTYNYDNRSYMFDTGDTITYGDEHITYITNEGDTYNFYYYVQPSEPTPSPGPAPTPESHHWVQDSHTDPTCTEPGVTTYHCTDCGESKTERIDALGHDWVEVESQPDSYTLPPGTVCPDCGSSDIESNLVVDQYHCVCNDCQREFTVNANVEYGYKKYVCSRCGFEKTEDNSFSSGLWSALGDFLSHSVEWIGEKLKLLTDSLSGLTDSLHDATEDVIDSAGEYPAFLSETVESFPTEFMSILWVCLIVVVIVLVFCKFLK